MTRCVWDPTITWQIVRPTLRVADHENAVRKDDFRSRWTYITASGEQVASGGFNQSLVAAADTVSNLVPPILVQLP